MGRVLLANELGEGMGHHLPWRATLARLAREAQWVGHASLGHPPRPGAAPDGVHALAAPPRPTPLRGLARAPTGWPELMVACGYAHPAEAAATLAGWMRLMQGHRIDHVIVDHAPLALLAAKVLGLRLTEAGSGFCVPPALRPMPAFMPQASTQQGQGTDAESLLLERWSRLLQGVGAARAPADLASLFTGHARQVCCIPQLDPYGPRAGVQYLGPLAVQAPPPARTGAEQWWMQQPGEVLAYLKLSTPGLKQVLGAIERSGRRTLAVIPGMAAEHRRGNVWVTGEAVALPSLLASAGLYVSNGGIHSVGLSVAARVPVIVVPLHVEQAITGQRLQRHGWGVCWHPDVDAPETLARALARG